MRVYVLKHKRVEEAALLIRPLLSDAASITLTQKLNAMTVTDSPGEARPDRQGPGRLRRAAARLHLRDQARAGARRRARRARSRSEIGGPRREAEVALPVQRLRADRLGGAARRRGRDPVDYQLGAEYLADLHDPARRQHGGKELLLSPFTLSKLWKPVRRRARAAASLPAASTGPRSRSPSPDAGPRRLARGGSKSALILILLAEERRATPAPRRAAAGAEGRGEAAVSGVPRQGRLARRLGRRAVGDGDRHGRRARSRSSAAAATSSRSGARASRSRGTRGAGAGRVKMGEFLIFNQELIALLKAGLPVVRSFEILLERQKSPTLRARPRRTSASGSTRASSHLRGVRRGGRPLPAPLLDLAQGGGEVGRDRGRAAPLPQVPEDRHRADAQGRLDARLSGDPDRPLGRPDHDPDDLRHPALHRVLRGLRRGAAAPDGRRPRRRDLPAAQHPDPRRRDRRRRAYFASRWLKTTARPRRGSTPRS